MASLRFNCPLGYLVSGLLIIKLTGKMHITNHLSPLLTSQEKLILYLNWRYEIHWGSGSHFIKVLLILPSYIPYTIILAQFHLTFPIHFKFLPEILMEWAALPHFEKF